jgi:hypothetical protein
MQKVIFSFLLLLAHPLLNGQNTIRITPQGEALKSFYHSLNVENHWIAGNHVNWETGEPDKPEAQSSTHTHCSAFVAAACKKMNFYILRPPEHDQLLLANAQYEWLPTQEAVNAGWKLIWGAQAFINAQELANNGKVVVAICMNPDLKKPGHAALVMPAETTTNKIGDDGPFVIMAGTHNFNKISLKHGFMSHIISWPATNILFYYNDHLPQL